MSGSGRVRARARSALAALPTPVAGALRATRRRARDADRRRVVAAVLDRAGQVVPGASRVFGERWSATLRPWSRVTVTGPDGANAPRDLDPDVDAGPPVEVAGTLLVRVPDAAALVRLADSGLLAGRVGAVRVRLDRSPAWLREGARPGVADPGTTRPTGLSWRTAGNGADVEVDFAEPVGVAAALDTVLRTVLRVRPWPQAGGPLPVLDRAAWLDGSATPGHGVLLDARPVAKSAGPGPLRPFADPAPWPGGHPLLCPVGAVGFPHRRRLLGEPARYRLAGETPADWRLTDAGGAVLARFDGSRSPEAVLADPSVTRYATVELPRGLTVPDGSAGRWADLVLASLAVGGLMPVPPDDIGRAVLARLGVPAPPDAAAVTGPDGYAWSAAVSRVAGVLADATLRRTGLALAVGGAVPGGAVLPLPRLSVLIATMRPDTVPAVLADLAAQTYPDFEVLVAPHGWVPRPGQVQEWAQRLGHPLRRVDVAPDTAFGDVLAALSRAADGDVLTKVDDDDVYGPDHLTDLVLAWRQTGADLVAKAPRFVHLQDTDGADGDTGRDTGVGTDPRTGGGRTVDRAWAASEVFGRTPAGGTLLAARSTLLDAGGWSGSIRHVDIDLTARIRQAGGVTYRTHGLGYTYVRHARGHTWAAAESVFLRDAGDVLDGLPAAIATGRPAGWSPLSGARA